MQVVQHNLGSQFTNRQLNITTGLKAKSTEKLSSGYRINRAADDAAGLSISEKMRWQIRGLDKASNNIQDGISLIQVADGALNEMHSIMNRMKELATQAANDTNTLTDRDAIQQEINALTSEIDHISETTAFNTKKILDPPGSVRVSGLSGDGIATMVHEVRDGNGRARYGVSMDFTNVTGAKDNLIGKSFQVSCSANCNQVFNFTFTDAASSTARTEAGGGGSSKPDLYVEIGMNDPELKTGEDVVNKLMSMALEQSAAMGSAPATGDARIGHANGMHAEGATLMLYSDQRMYSATSVPSYASGMGQVRAIGMDTADSVLHIQSGALAYQDIPINLTTINATRLGVSGLLVDSFEHAGETMEKVDSAIDQLSMHRSYFGAMQNRLEHARAVDEITSENTSASESRLRDTDMAKEMVNFSKHGILEQAGQAMLTQANQQPQGILSLLQ